MAVHTGKYTLDSMQAEQYTRMCVHVQKPRTLSQTTFCLCYTLSQTRTNKNWVLQGYFDFSPSVQMKCLSSQILCEEKKKYTTYKTQSFLETVAFGA